MPRKADPSPILAVEPASLAKERKRNDAWKLHLRGVQPAEIAEKVGLSERQVSRLIDETYRLQRGMLARDNADNLALYLNRLDQVRAEAWAEYEYEGEMREKFLAGEYDRTVTVPAGKGQTMMAQGGPPQLRFNRPTLLQLIAQIDEKSAKATGVAGSERVDIRQETHHVEAQLKVLEIHGEDPELVALLRRSILGPADAPGAADALDEARGADGVIDGECVPGG